MPALSGPMATAAAAPVNSPFFMVHCAVLGDPFWGWTGQADRSFTIAGDPLLSAGQVFVASGSIGAISDITLGSDGAVESMTLTLFNADFTDPTTYDFVNSVDKWSRRLAVVWLGFVTTATGAIVADPIRCATMRMVHVAVTDGSSPAIIVKLASKAASDGARANGWLLANGHQQVFYPTDTALSYITQLVGKELRFGVPGDSVPGVKGNSGGQRPDALRQHAV